MRPTPGPSEPAHRHRRVSARFSGWLAGALVCASLVCASVPCRAQAPDAAPPTIGAVVKEMPRDLWKFVNWDTALILGVGGAAAGIGHIWDDDLSEQVSKPTQFNAAVEPGHKYGGFSVQVAIGAGLYTTGWLAKTSKLAMVGGDIMRSQVLSQVYVQALKFSVQRERPDGSDHYSFPSGHSASAFATAGVLQRHYGWKVGVPSTIVAGYVATARVHDNKHHLSDVIFGGAMGIAAERTVTLHAGRYGFALTPAPTPGGAQVAVTLERRR